jgi:hypothetical protein
MARWTRAAAALALVTGVLVAAQVLFPSAAYATSSHMTTIGAGYDASSCAIRGGKAYCWGANASGELGNDSTISSDTHPDWMGDKRASIGLRWLLHHDRNAQPGVGAMRARRGRQPARHHRRAARVPRFKRRLATAVAAAALAAVIPAVPAVPAAAAGTGGSQTFGLTPMPGRPGQAAPYFTMTLAPGQPVTATALISNPGKTTDTLKISPSTGITAVNGGSAFSRAFQRCSGAGCWVTGLPGTVILPPDTEEALRFTVRVPAGTPPGQYLAGLTAGPAAMPQPVAAGPGGTAQAEAIIIERVTIGVAVTVGPLSRLTTRFRIPGVSGAAIGAIPRLNIRLDNTGQTFAHAAGTASCTADGKPHSFAVFAATVLPHDGAEIAVNAPGLPEGTTVPCRVRLRYGSGLTVSWAGLVALPAAVRARIVHTGPGAYSVVPVGSGFLPWLIALLTVTVLFLAALAIVLRRQRQRRRHVG